MVGKPLLLMASARPVWIVLVIALQISGIIGGTILLTCRNVHEASRSIILSIRMRANMFKTAVVLMFVLVAFPSLAQETTSVSQKAPEEGGPRNWQVFGVSDALNLRDSPSVTGLVVGRFPPGTILDNLGCMPSQGRTWCYVQRFGGGPVGYVAGEFLRGAVSPDGAVAIGPDDSALRAGRGEFDATGTIPCAQYAGQPTVECKFGVSRAGESCDGCGVAFEVARQSAATADPGESSLDDPSFG